MNADDWITLGLIALILAGSIAGLVFALRDTTVSADEHAKNHLR